MSKALYEHTPHPRIKERTAEKPPRVADQLRRVSGVDRFNATLAVGITKGVGSMWCAYVFAGLALTGLPSAVNQGGLALVQWISQTFLQLVLLSIIMVGQDVQGQASDQRAAQTYKDAEAILHECLELQRHLKAQDDVLVDIIDKVEKFPGASAPV